MPFWKMMHEAEENILFPYVFLYGLDVGWIKNQKGNWSVKTVHEVLIDHVVFTSSWGSGCWTDSLKAAFPQDLSLSLLVTWFTFSEWSRLCVCVWYSHFYVSNPNLCPKIQTYICNRLLDTFTWKSLKCFTFSRLRQNNVYTPTVSLVEVVCIMISRECLGLIFSLRNF